jgi:hypothetical protein
MRTLFTGVVVALLTCQCGCSMMRGRVARMMPDSEGYADGTDATSDPWIAEASGEGRADYRTDTEADPFGWKPLFMSQKARDIEKNLGVE